MEKKHGASPTDEKFDIETSLVLVTEASNALSHNQCYLQEIRDTITHYTFPISEVLLNAISKLYVDLQTTSDLEVFYSAFFSQHIYSSGRKS